MRTHTELGLRSCYGDLQIRLYGGSIETLERRWVEGDVEKKTRPPCKEVE